MDASRALSREPTGVNRFAKEFIDHVPSAMPDARFILYAPAWLAAEASRVFPELAKNCSWRFLRWPPRILWTQVCLAFAWRKEERNGKRDIFFAPAHVPPYFMPRRTIAMVHDAAHKHVRQAYSFFEQIFANMMIHRIVARATHIVAPSRATHDDLIIFFCVAQEKISVIPLAPTCRALSHPSAETIVETKKKFLLPKQFILHVGRIEYKKGIDRLVSAFEKLPANYELVLAGSRGQGYSVIKKIISASPARERICELGYVSDRELVALYSAAHVYALASRYEGFGFNPLEAMFHGVPVVAWSVGSVPEVVGDAALLACDEASFARALKIACEDEKMRSSLIENGNERVRNFSWEKTAIGFAEEFRSFVGLDNKIL